MGKYDKFTQYLSETDANVIRLTFDEIEAIVGSSLPASKAYQAWWSNNPWNNVMTKAWLKAGFKSTQVDVPNETVSFVRTSHVVETPESHEADEQTKPPRSPLFGCMKGTTIIAPGVDLTEPADPEWSRVYDNDYIPPSAPFIVKDPALSISAKIRELNEIGVSRAQIARLLGKRYQHVRNVLNATSKKAG